MNVLWEGDIGAHLMPLEKIRNFGEKFPKSQQSAPNGGGLDCWGMPEASWALEGRAWSARASAEREASAQHDARASLALASV